MAGHILTLSALVALTQAKAIVTNHCPHDVYIWSVPQVGSSHTDNVPIKSGGRYEEPWRHGSAANPGIALKISPQANGINEGKDEIDFAYSIDYLNKAKIWVDLSPVRGKAFDNNLGFHTCRGSYHTPDVQTQQCDATDDIELVLCDMERTTPPHDVMPLHKIEECYDYHHVYHGPDQENPKCTTECGDETDDEQPGRPKCTNRPVPHNSEKPYHPAPGPTTGRPSHAPPPTPSMGRPSSPAPPQHTSEHHYAPPTPTNDVSHYSPHGHTDGQHPPPEQTTAQYTAPEHTSEEQYQAPTHTSDENHSGPPSWPTREGGRPTQPTSILTHPVQTSDNSRYPQPKPTNDEPHHPHHPPQQSTADAPYYPPPKPTSGPPQHYHPPNNTTETSYSRSSQISPPSPTSSSTSKFKPTRKPYPPPPESTAEAPYPPPSRPTYLPRTFDSECPCQKPHSRGPNHCLARVVYPWRRAALLKDRNNISVQAKPRSTIPLGVVLQHEAAKHGDVNQTVKNTTASSPLCDIVRKYYPGITECDEQAMKMYANEIHPHLCEPVYKELLHGVNCNQVKQELKKAFPGVDKPASLHVRDPPKKCVLPWCDPAQPGLNCTEIEEIFDERDKASNVDWTSDDEVCNGFLMATNATRHGSPQRRARDQICIAQVCEQYKLSDKACETAEDFFEQVAKDNGQDIDYTTDDDACGKSLTARNATLPAIAKLILSRSPAPLARAAEEEICVLPYCNGLTEAACDKAEDLLEQLAKDDGKDIDYTTDDDVCGAK